ncbi:MAG: NADPH:quinone reductase [Anaerolineae bacterium]|nr:NADPH:quinone reductase [Phycisphaerae bacterium]
MQAIRVHGFGGPEVLKLDELPDPKPGPGQILMRVNAAGVNPVDTYIRSGKYAALPKLPYIPGTDAAGTIAALGDGVANWKIGDRVYCDKPALGFGSYATHTICEVNHVHRLPDNVSFAQGAAVNVPYGTAYRALFHRAYPKPGETVLVHGATGGVGIAAVQFAFAHGCIVIGTGGSERGRELVARQGAVHVLDHKSKDYLDELMKFTNNVGVNVIIEMLANVNLDNDLKVLAKFGRVVIIGNRGRVEIDPRQTMGKESSILGMNYWAGGDAAVAEAHHAIVAGLSNSTLRPIVDREYPLAEAAKAHEDVMGEGSSGKIVLKTD